MKIDMEHFTKKLHGRTVLDNVSLHFDSGDKGLIVGLQGINGSGKTMLIRALCGLIYATQGTVSVDGQVLGKDISFPPSVGALIENPAFLNEYTGRKNLELLGSIRGKVLKSRIDEALSSVGLDPDDRRAYRKYSLGMKQRLGIAAALYEENGLSTADRTLPEAVLLCTVTIERNGPDLVGQEQADLKMPHIAAVSGAWSSMVDTGELYHALNKETVALNELRQGEKQTYLLPFELWRGSFSDISWEHLSERSFMLQLSLYPNKCEILL